MFPSVKPIPSVKPTTQSSTSVVDRTNKIILRSELKANPKTLYLFGDNDIRKGLGGQAKEMRGEPNAIGVSTKKLPARGEEAYKSDDDLQENKRIITNDINKVIAEWNTGKYNKLIIPQMGVGLAELPTRAPETYKFLQQELKRLEDQVTQSTVEPVGEVKEGVAELFESNPELASIGTQEQYSQYLNTVFPNSKVKDIVYHGSTSKEKFENFKLKYGNDESFQGFYFADTKFQSEGIAGKEGRVFPVLLNANPKLGEFGITAIKEDINQAKIEGYNSLREEDELRGKDFNTTIVFEPEQIHILGGKEDIEGFKNFVSGEPSTSVKPTNINLNLFGLEGFNIPDTGDTC